MLASKSKRKKRLKRRERYASIVNDVAVKKAVEVTQNPTLHTRKDLKEAVSTLKKAKRQRGC